MWEQEFEMEKVKKDTAKDVVFKRGWQIAQDIKEYNLRNVLRSISSWNRFAGTHDYLLV